MWNPKWTTGKKAWHSVYSVGRTDKRGKWREEEKKEKKVKQQAKEKRARKIDIDRKKRGGREKGK